ncbi:leucyl aminopeptidase (aminopeptidase T) [Schinkia azotoformans MEV2011]|uniref:Leucyl aminopeptidase (Aminopeptidase T) n=1 Tax=Schinkia azotoformans MEV2011 TaxID=1348973 RepID=A0A072P196_SCHAZ|nr:aminopeptidase [Schinkia azotoformans]KEF39260.1 leucyl aminopeptidase (aminopeptidase T) [Schinkia azotoformans MEV2011]MEC1694986.1 aminopeptidase [Schinkia azotoformans]MEC1716144.1 aminopeptidase [Schinkia azotoformans]MEC1725597.1 aminopeptidase [Schinkia azotoformans]MEC1739972.1 aminopeptidase [Schinkia azotoformans]
MVDPRIKQLAKTILAHSIKLQSKQRVLIKGHVNAKPLILELIDQTYQLGAYPYVEMLDDDISRQLFMGYEKEQLETIRDWDMKKYQDVDAIVVIIGEENDAELADVPREKFRIRGEVMKPVQQFYINNRKWVLLNFPTRGLAQKAGMSSPKFADFLLDVCNVDYQKMAKAMKPLKALMEQTDRVRIVAPGTDLTFSIKGIPAIMCAGENNIPDGEVFTAPVRDSVNGTIAYNTPCPYQGTTFRNVSLTFKDGKIVEARADQTEKINEIFDIDEGARYVGEFAIGVNPLIREPMGDILFDEKICGSLHFTPGEAYEEAFNGNRSSIHWDMVLIQRPEYGGGEIYFDDVLIRKDGLFVVDELEGLNPDSLK